MIRTMIRMMIRRLTPRCFLMLFALVSVAGSAETRRMVIIDQDGAGPAGTNQMAMMLLLQSPQAEVLGITMVTGDAWEPEAVQHTLRMLELINRTDVPVVPGAAEFVRSLQKGGVPMAVATSATPENARLSLSRAKMEGIFDIVITAADVANGKPDPEPYLKAAERLGVSATTCLVIEDSVSGIRSAKSAGAKCLALATTFPRESLSAESPDWLVASFADIPSAIFGRLSMRIL